MLDHARQPSALAANVLNRTQRQALARLSEALIRFLDDAPGSLDPKPGWIPIVEGHYLHQAVMEVEQYFDHPRLPRPGLDIWRRLLRSSRREDETPEVGSAAVEMLEWVDSLVGTKAPSNELITVTAAAKLLKKDIPGLTLEQAKARVSIAANRNEFRTNDKKGTQRRIDSVSFDAWRLKQRDRALDAAG